MFNILSINGSNHRSVFYVTLILLLYIYPCLSSNGDRTSFFIHCQQNCERQNCSADGIEFQEQAIKYYQQSIFDRLFQWKCIDECRYGCMWRTVQAFQDRRWATPKFYGKWPFIRILGLQEPASVFFSFLNFISHFRNLRRLRRQVRPESPCFKLWHIFSTICLNAWIWSIVFHARDLPLTELLDYAFAYSIVLSSLFCFILRILHRYSMILRALILIVFLSFYINYYIYLSTGRLNYTNNIKANLLTGCLTTTGWIIWALNVRKYRPYYWKVILFFVLIGLSFNIEQLDFPPFFWILDGHAIWHLITSCITHIFYSFIIADCQQLLKECNNEIRRAKIFQ